MPHFGHAKHKATVLLPGKLSVNVMNQMNNQVGAGLCQVKVQLIVLTKISKGSPQNRKPSEIWKSSRLNYPPPPTPQNLEYFWKKP